MKTIIYFLILAGICFLFTLNLFLRGSKKQYIDAFLGLIIIISIVASFFILGWQWGVVILVSPFIFVRLSKPFAQALAYRLLGYRTGVDDQSESIDNMLEQLASGEDGFSKVFEKIDRETENNRKRLLSIANRPNISCILERHNIPFDEYENYLVSLKASTLHDLAWEIISTPDDLDTLIGMKEQGASEMEIWSHFRNFIR